MTMSKKIKAALLWGAMVAAMILSASSASAGASWG
jgi:hypothetical protein